MTTVLIRSDSMFAVDAQVVTSNSSQAPDNLNKKVSRTPRSRTTTPSARKNSLANGNYIRDVDRELAQSDPDRFIETKKARRQNDTDTFLRRSRRDKTKNSKLRRLRVAEVIVAEHRATWRTRVGVNSGQPWQIYTGNKLRRIAPDELSGEIRRAARRKNCKR